MPDGRTLEVKLIVGGILSVNSSRSFLIQALYSFLVFESASFALTQIIAMSSYRGSDIPLKVLLELP